MQHKAILLSIVNYFVTVASMIAAIRTAYIALKRLRRKPGTEGGSKDPFEESEDDDRFLELWQWPERGVPADQAEELDRRRQSHTEDCPTPD